MPRSAPLHIGCGLRTPTSTRTAHGLRYFIGGSYKFEQNGAVDLDAKSVFFFYATGITPAMTMKMVGEGSQYAAAFVDAKGNSLDGTKTYKLHVPPHVPAKDFWSFTVYDNQTARCSRPINNFPPSQPD